MVDARLPVDADGPGGVVDDDVGAALAQFGVNLGIRFYVEGGTAVWLTGVNMDNAGPGFHAAPGLLGNLGGGVGNGGGLFSGSEDAG